MKKIFIFLLFRISAHAQSYSPGLPLPGLPRSVGPKTMAGSTSVTFATDQTPITVTATTTAGGKTAVDFARLDYSITPVTSAGYTELIASTPGPATEVEVFDSSGRTLKLAFGAAGFEVDQFYIFPGGNGSVPLDVPAGTRLSIEAVSISASAGEIDVNLYN